MTVKEKKEVSCRAWSLFGYCLFTVTCASGLVYGWPSLRRNLLEQDSNLSEASLGAIFTIGSWSTQGGRFFFGILRDRCCGTRNTTCLALLCATGGSLGIALGHADNGVALGVSIFFVGLGSGAQLCLQPVAGLFPKRMQGTVLASLSGAFQVSGLVFLALTAMSSDRAKSFGGFAAGLAVIAVVSAFILPRDKFEAKNKSKVETQGSAESVTPNTETAVEVATKELSTQGDRRIEEVIPEPSTHCVNADDTVEKDDVTTVVNITSMSGTDEDHTAADASDLLHHDAEASAQHVDDAPPTALQQMKNSEYIGLVGWFSVLIIPLQYYIATIGFQLERKGDDNGFYTGLFSIVYASCALFAPLMGKVADVAGLGVGQAVSTTLVALSLFILAARDLGFQVMGMALYGLGRLMTLSMLFTNVGKRFGYGNYGTLAGLSLLLSAMASWLQYPLITLSADGHETAVNVTCGVALICLLPYCAWLGMREKKECDTMGVDGAGS